MLTEEPKALESTVKLESSSLVVINEVLDSFVYPFTVIVIKPSCDPEGTVMVSCVWEAEATVALIPPMKTILLEGVELKFVPVIVTVDPTSPDEGLKEVIVGFGNKTEKLCSTLHPVELV